MPFGKWASFDDCVADMMDKEGYDEETAKQVCGKLQSELEGARSMIERRAFEFSEVRAAKDRLAIEGHAAVFNRLSEDVGGFREQIAPGAFAQTIAEDDIIALFNHDPNQVLGRNRAGTLKLAEDNIGLRMEIDLPDTQLGRDLVKSVERRDITGASFAFWVPQGGEHWEHLEQGDLRTLLFVRLQDVSPVTFPAYKQTDVALAKRSWEQWQKAQTKPLEPVARLLRERRQSLAELEP